MKRDILKIAEEADRFFMGVSPIHETMRRLASALNAMEIPFAVAGAMASNAHGHHRTTSDVGVLLRREELNHFKQQWLGKGWVEKFEGSKGFRDAKTNVSVDVLISGEYPGDDLEKPVCFPDLEKAVTRVEGGIPYLDLPTLIELKLASGMTADHRPRDLDDVIQLIRVNRLSIEFAEKLNPYVREKYQQMWTAAQVEEEY